MTPKEYRAQYYQNNKHKWQERAITHRDRKNELAREYAARNKELVREKSIRWIKNNFEYNLWSQAKRRATRDGLEFSLDREDVVIPTYCPYLNVKLTKEWGKGQLPTNASIDRIDSSKGYIKGNIQVISRLANTMKSNATKEELIVFATNVLFLNGVVDAISQR